MGKDHKRERAHEAEAGDEPFSRADQKQGTPSVKSRHGQEIKSREHQRELCAPLHPICPDGVDRPGVEETRDRPREYAEKLPRHIRDVLRLQIETEELDAKLSDRGTAELESEDMTELMDKSGAQKGKGQRTRGSGECRKRPEDRGKRGEGELEAFPTHPLFRPIFR